MKLRQIIKRVKEKSGKAVVAGTGFVLAGAELAHAEDPVDYIGSVFSAVDISTVPAKVIALITVFGVVNLIWYGYRQLKKGLARG